MYGPWGMWQYWLRLCFWRWMIGQPAVVCFTSFCLITTLMLSNTSHILFIPMYAHTISIFTQAANTALLNTLEPGNVKRLMDKHVKSVCVMCWYSYLYQLVVSILSQFYSSTSFILPLSHSLTLSFWPIRLPSFKSGLMLCWRKAWWRLITCVTIFKL